MKSKKIGLILLATLVTLLLAMVIVPMAFKGKIISKVKQMANESMLAKLDFKEADLSLFRSFPQLDIRLNNLSISGINEFEGKTLLSVSTLSTSVSLSSLWKSDGITVSEIVLDNPQFIFLVNSAGKVNWDIVKSSDSPTSTKAKSPLKIELSKIELKNAGFTYQDDQSKMITQFREGNFELSGILQGSDSKLNFKGKADSISFEYGGKKFVNGMKVAGEGALQANFDQMSFRFLNNKLLINQLPLELQGTFVMGDKADQYDLTFQSGQSTLEELISFLPADQQQKLKTYEKSGKLSFSGSVKGTWSDQTYPSILADLILSDGRLKYSSKPNEVNKINMAVKLSKPEGPMDSLKISISRLEAYVAGRPIIANLLVTTPDSNPILAGNLIGEIDFSSLKNTIQMDSVEINGIAKASIQFNGPVSSIEKGEYDRFQTKGDLTLRDFSYRSPGFPETLGIQTAGFVFNSKEINISSMKGKLGASDFTVDGSFTDYWAYILKDGTLKGNIKFKSSYLDVTQLMNGGTQPKDTTIHSDPYVIPARVDLTVQADVDRMLYSRMDIRGTTGTLIIRDQKLNLDQLSMNMLKGKMVLSGTYAAKEKSPADFNFKMELKDFDLPTAYQSVGIVRHFLPIAGNSKGTFLSGISLNGTLGKDYAPNFGTLNGAGQLSLKSLELVGTNLFSEIGKYFRKDLFTNVRVNDFSSNITITNGALSISPFTTKIANQEVTISGSQSLALDLNFRLNFKVNKSDLSSDVTGLIGLLPGTENIDKYPIGISLGGNIAKPEVKVDLSEAKNLVETEFKKKAKSTFQDAAKKFGLENLFK
jgi:uncharacterized protein involved in outer membrane biogenesis